MPHEASRSLLLELEKSALRALPDDGVTPLDRLQRHKALRAVRRVEIVVHASTTVGQECAQPLPRWALQLRW